MFSSFCDADIEARVSVFDGESDEPVIVRIGNFGCHMTRDEAIDLMSQIEKAVHSLVEVSETRWTVKK